MQLTRGSRICEIRKRDLGDKRERPAFAPGPNFITWKVRATAETRGTEWHK
jgi:hypothetical protein